MTDNDDNPIALEAYEKLAHAYSAKSETKAENGYNEHPAMRSCIGSVDGLAVLDAGCGPGFLTRDLVAGGARRVVGFDISPTMIEIARERVGNDAEFMIADLAKPLDLPGDVFDLVVSSLAIDYVRDWSVPLAEFHRVLSDNGRLVMSVQHPMGSYQWFQPPSAFGVHYCETEWKGFTDEPVVVPDYYRSFEEIINPIIKAGFTLTNIHETRPVDALRAIDPRKYAKNSTFPTFMVLEAVVSSASLARH
ncbi:MAG: methyltransferase domain-containing protein [Pseudomonadota bacterium]